MPRKNQPVPPAEVEVKRPRKPRAEKPAAPPAEVEVKVKRPPPSPRLDVSQVETLLRIGSSADGHRDLVGQMVDPMNVFALQYGRLAKAARDLAALIEERGHAGVPPAKEETE